MVRLIAIVAALLMFSAISLVTARFQSRQLFVVSDRLATKARDLDTDWRRLQLARAELARNARIDGTARGELKMINVTPGRTIYIKDGPAAAPPAAAAPVAPAAAARSSRRKP
ncbi:cell division protein FtsL [Paralcaligenes sp. KSB-10]|uniref:cell division protein FtsL n=1 Tax=Paralcaligenes sp. KSB-10 TaxID=2901142 RepID=UPI001E5C9FFA|nr:cell division protein FtsL [Paralcaligenes sp. KSB-10]UHL65826.1 cell division protein FtsL [Paralcaligenes sp. KSB-10]